MLWVAGGSMCERMCVTAPALTAIAVVGLSDVTLNLVSMFFELFNDYYLRITHLEAPMG